MFDVGFWEISVIGVVALIIVGPERLPGLARTAGLWIGKARRMISDVKRDIDREIKASEMGELKEGLDSAKKEVEKAASNIKQASGADEIQSTLKEAVDKGGSELDEIDQVDKQIGQSSLTVSGNTGIGADSRYTRRFAFPRHRFGRLQGLGEFVVRFQRGRCTRLGDKDR